MCGSSRFLLYIPRHSCYNLCMTKFRKILRWVLRSLAALLLLSVIGLGGGAVWLWGWTWKGAPDFHESWTAGERAAITEFDRYLRQDLARDTTCSIQNWYDMLNAGFGGTRSVGLIEHLSGAYAAKQIADPISGMLHQIAESGDARETGTVSYEDTHGFTPAIVAGLTAHLDALEALVRHGANPNAQTYHQANEFTNPMDGDTPLSPTINGQFINGRRLPWEPRRQTAEFLLEQGADLNSAGRMHALSCAMPIILRQQEGATPWLWAIEHGMKVQHEYVASVMSYPAAQPLLERVLREKRVDVNDVSGKITMLQALVKILVYPFDEERWQDDQVEEIMLPRLNMLLTAGADPNLIPTSAEPQRPGESDEEYDNRMWDTDTQARKRPLEIVETALERAELPAQRELCRRVIERLRAAGAVSRSAQ